MFITSYFGFEDLFASDLAASNLCSDLDALNDLSVDDLAKLYRDVLTDLLDRHCPTVKVLYVAETFRRRHGLTQTAERLDVEQELRSGVSGGVELTKTNESGWRK